MTFTKAVLTGKTDGLEPSIHKLETILLGQEWLKRWEKSDAKVARTQSKSDEKEFEEKIRRHSQFR